MGDKRNISDMKTSKLEGHLAALEKKHRDLDLVLQDDTMVRSSTPQAVAQMKHDKLKLKREIDAIKDELNSRPPVAAAAA